MFFACVRMCSYGQRIGCFSLTCNNEEEKVAVESQMKRIARATYSNPPLHGALLVSTVLGDPALKAQWYVAFFPRLMRSASLDPYLLLHFPLSPFSMSDVRIPGRMRKKRPNDGKIESKS